MTPDERRAVQKARQDAMIAELIATFTAAYERGDDCASVLLPPGWTVDHARRMLGQVARQLPEQPDWRVWDEAAKPLELEIVWS